jgi:hypothetical protein
MGTDLAFRRDQCERTLVSTDFPELGERFEGKIRDACVARARRNLAI